MSTSNSCTLHRWISFVIASSGLPKGVANDLNYSLTAFFREVLNYLSPAEIVVVKTAYVISVVSD